MTDELTPNDKYIIEDLNFLRLDSVTIHGIFTFPAMFFFPIVFNYPYEGWRHKPLNPPLNSEEYISKVLPLPFIWFLVILIPILNLLIKIIELKVGTKKVIQAEVVYRRTLFFRRKLILFKPFIPPIIFRRGFNLAELKQGDLVELELTILGRLIRFHKITSH